MRGHSLATRLTFLMWIGVQAVRSSQRCWMISSRWRKLRHSLVLLKMNLRPKIPTNLITSRPVLNRISSQIKRNHPWTNRMSRYCYPTCNSMWTKYHQPSFMCCKWTKCNYPLVVRRCCPTPSRRTMKKLKVSWIY